MKIIFCVFFFASFVSFCGYFSSRPICSSWFIFTGGLGFLDFPESYENNFLRLFFCVFCVFLRLFFFAFDFFDYFCVENLENKKKVLVRINDRGPFVKGRIIDLSRKAGRQIGIEETGTVRVLLRIVKASDMGKVSRPEPAKTTTPEETSIEREEITVTEVKETDIPQSTPLPTEPLSTPSTVQREIPGGHYVQAGAFGSMKNAKRLVRHIKRILPQASFNIQYKDGLYKVLSDKLDSRAAAEKMKNYLDENGIEAFIKKETNEQE
jgi:rare lipoprotein A